MNLPTVQVQWSMPVPFADADASSISPRPGVYELLFSDGGVLDRLYVGSTEDLRRCFISSLAGSKIDPEIQRELKSREAYFRYWECDSRARRAEVLCALADKHFYEIGSDEINGATAFIRVTEVE